VTEAPASPEFHYTGLSITNKQSPSGSGEAFCFVPTTLVLAPQ